MLITQTERERIATTESNGSIRLHTTCKEVSILLLPAELSANIPLRMLPNAIHVVITNSTSYHIVKFADSLCIISPKFSTAYVDIIVVTECITLIYELT